jgi:hypothetical protein
MTKDRELLELAAKAAGIPLKADFKERFEYYMADRLMWNPLKDDGDALRLTVKLGIETYHADDGGWAAYASHPTARGIAYAVEQHGDDPYAATRRAIVRAAAEIGRQMP